MTAAAAAGDYASLATFETDYHYRGEQQQLGVYDLLTGTPSRGSTARWSAVMGTRAKPPWTTSINSQGFTAVHTVATADCGQETHESPCEAIQVSDSAGPRIIDTAGPYTGKPVLTDLALSGDTLTWKHAGTLESTQLH